MKLSPFQRFFSYFYPVKISSAAGKTTPVLGLYRFRGRWQLSAATALYSDGAAYRPLTSAFTYLRKELPRKQQMLVLGAGLGSAVSVLYKINKSIPRTTLVDIDPQVINWGKELTANETGQNADWVCADVQEFMSRHDQQYDLIVLDVFQDRLVPAFVTTPTFLMNCRRSLHPNDGTLVLNYIINNEASWNAALAVIRNTFKVEHTISIGINRILILRNIV